MPNYFGVKSYKLGIRSGETEVSVAEKGKFLKFDVVDEEPTVWFSGDAHMDGDTWSFLLIRTNDVIEGHHLDGYDYLGSVGDLHLYGREV